MSKRKKNGKMKITGLELCTKDGVTVPLTLAEAKELYEQLDDLFGKTVEYRYPWLSPRPYWTWYGTPNAGHFGCTASSNTTTVMSNIANWQTPADTSNVLQLNAEGARVLGSGGSDTTGLKISYLGHDTA